MRFNGGQENIGYYEVGYLIGNFDGEIKLSNNCIYNNEVTIAPVINQGKIQALSNTGQQALTSVNYTLFAGLGSAKSRNGNAETAALATEYVGVTANSSSTGTIMTWDPPIDHSNARCEFIASISRNDDLGAVNPELMSFTSCETFDSDKCAHPDAPTELPSLSPSISPRPTTSPRPTLKPTKPPSISTSGTNSMLRLQQRATGIFSIGVAAMLVL